MAFTKVHSARGRGALTFTDVSPRITLLIKSVSIPSEVGLTTNQPSEPVDGNGGYFGRSTETVDEQCRRTLGSPVVALAVTGVGCFWGSRMSFLQQADLFFPSLEDSGVSLVRCLFDQSTDPSIQLIPLPVG